MTQFFKFMMVVLVAAPGLVLAACPASGSIDVGQLTTKVTSINFDTDNRRNSITSFGTLNNASLLCAQEIVVEVRYFDATGAQVDVTTQTLGLSIAAGQESAFRVRDDADKPRDAYATSTIRVISVEPLFGRASRDSASWWLDLFFSWFPTLVMLLVFGLLLRRLAGKNSPQRQSLALVERQQQILERIAAALEQRIQR